MLFFLFLLLLNQIKLSDFNENEVIIESEKPKLIILFNNPFCSSCLYKFSSISQTKEYKSLGFNETYILSPFEDNYLNKRNLINTILLGSFKKLFYNLLVVKI